MTASLRPDIAVDARATLGEGRVWDEQWQRLLRVDILLGLAHRFDRPPAATRSSAWATRSGRPGCAAAASSSPSRTAWRCWTRAESGSTRSPPSSTPGPPARFNEGTCDRAGWFLAGTMAYDQAPGAGRCTGWTPACARGLPARRFAG